MVLNLKDKYKRLNKYDMGDDMTLWQEDGGNDGFFLQSSAPAPRPALQPPFVKSPLS